MRRDLCDSAKRGQVCIDDLCRSNPDNTLCGFDQSEYDHLTRDYNDEEPYEFEDDDPRDADEAAFDRAAANEEKR